MKLIKIPLALIVVTLMASCGSAEFDVVRGKKQEKPKQAVPETPPPPVKQETKIPNNLPPVVFEATATPLKVTVGSPVKFIGKCSYQSKGVLKWDLKDGNISFEDSFDYTYKKAGTYDVQASCQNDGKEPLIKTLQVIVSEKPNNCVPRRRCCCCC